MFCQRYSFLGRLKLVFFLLPLVAIASGGQTKPAQSKQLHTMSKDFRKSARLAVDEFQAVLQGDPSRAQHALSLMGQAQIDVTTAGDKQSYSALRNLANMTGTYLSDKLTLEQQTDLAEGRCKGMGYGSHEKVECMQKLVQDYPSWVVKSTVSYNVARACAKHLDTLLGSGQFTGMGECESK